MKLESRFQREKEIDAEGREGRERGSSKRRQVPVNNRYG